MAARQVGKVHSTTAAGQADRVEGGDVSHGQCVGLRLNPGDDDMVKRKQMGWRYHRLGLVLVLTLVVAGSAGIDCSSDVAATFRQEVVDDVATGLKTILDGVIDALAAAIKSAGDGGGSGSSNSP